MLLKVKKKCCSMTTSSYGTQGLVISG